MKKKTLIVIITAAVIICASVFAVFSYVSNHPSIQIIKTVSDNGIDNYYERIMIVSGENSWIQASETKTNEIQEIAVWNAETEKQITENYKEPMHIEVSGETDNKTTVLRYKGYAQDAKGNTVQINEEKTFDFALVSSEQLLSNS